MPKREPKSAFIHLRAPPKLLEAARAAAEEDKLPFSEWVRLAIYHELHRQGA